MENFQNWMFLAKKKHLAHFACREMTFPMQMYQDFEKRSELNCKHHFVGDFFSSIRYLTSYKQKSTVLEFSRKGPEIGINMAIKYFK